LKDWLQEKGESKMPGLVRHRKRDLPAVKAGSLLGRKLVVLTEEPRKASGRGKADDSHVHWTQ
jgi:hypothetical protein